jgi:3D-(3,5/4)-trihydroxycyclohexane-1,2-dione acylhydrolase (decyclizing)
MGYEIAGGIGIKMAQPEREVYVMIGDGSYLMLSTELVTAVAEGIKITVVLLDNHGFASIGGLSKSVGSDGFGTKYRYRSEDGELDGDIVPVDFAANAASLGAHVIQAHDRDSLAGALAAAREVVDRPVVILIETDRSQRVGGYESWWDVAVAEVSDNPAVQAAREAYVTAKQKERYFLGGGS